MNSLVIVTIALACGLQMCQAICPCMQGLMGVDLRSLAGPSPAGLSGLGSTITGVASPVGTVSNALPVLGSVGGVNAVGSVPNALLGLGGVAGGAGIGNTVANAVGNVPNALSGVGGVVAGATGLGLAGIGGNLGGLTPIGFL